MHNLIDEILNKPWMIEHQYKMSMTPQVIRMVQGKTVSFNQPKDIQVVGYVKNNSYSFSTDLEEAADKVVAVVAIKGAITKSDQLCGPKGTESINKQIKSLGRNPNVAAIVLDMDTPGGQASFLSTLANTIKETTEKKPVLAYYSGLCASAGYFIASSCDEIYASESTDIVGSIGTVSSFLDYTKAFEKAGIVLHEIYATQSTNKNRLISEALKGNYKPYQEEILNPFAKSFINTVKSNRSITNEEVFTGSTYMSNKAIELNLIDGIKTFEKVIDRAFELSNTQSNNKSKQSNSNNMKKELITVATFLALNGLEVHDGHVTLSEENATKIATAFGTTKLATFLALNGLEVKEGHVKFTEENMIKIGAALSTIESQKTPKSENEPQSIDLENDPKIIAIENSITKISNSVNSFKTELNEIKTLLGGKPSTTPSTTTASKSELDEDGNEVDPWNDPEDQFNKQLAQDMGDSPVPSELGA